MTGAANQHIAIGRRFDRMKRVIAAYGDRVVMDETLAGALAALFLENAPAAPPAGAPARTGLAGPEADRAQEALSHTMALSSS